MILDRSLVAGFSILLVFATVHIVFNGNALGGVHRGLRLPFLVGDDEFTQFNVPESAREWCTKSELPPLTYRECDPSKTVFDIPLVPDLPHGLRSILLGAIYAYEADQCFYVDDGPEGILAYRNESSKRVPSLLQRYFEPIGLPRKDPWVIGAREQGRFERQSVHEVWGHLESRRIFGTNHTLPSLGLHQLEGHYLKRIMLRRLWRPTGAIRHATCMALGDLVFGQEFITVHVRRYDVHPAIIPSIEKYTAAIDRAIEYIFNGVTPIVVVVTDECSVLGEFQRARPDIQFASPCIETDPIYNVSMAYWTIEETDRFYARLFVELWAIASAKYYIGIGRSSLAWFGFFMRTNHWSFELLDTPNDMSSESIVNFW